jgi:putative membrane protein
MLDLSLAIARHLLIFAIFGILFAEFWAIRPGMSGATVARIADFEVIGILSLPPTVAFIRWRKSGSLPSDPQIRKVRQYLHAELALFVFLPIFAAAMARGYGEF